MFEALDRYPRLSIEETAYRLAGRRFRIGAYGDPAAVPIDPLAGLIAHTRGHTAYTHKIDRAPLLGRIAMVSADTAEQAVRYQARGFRTYRTRHVDENGHPEPLLPGEIMCPKSAEFKAERGYKLTCADCLICNGTGGKFTANVAIVDHSSSARSRTKRRLPLVQEVAA
jgi:hypothetical protein